MEKQKQRGYGFWRRGMAAVLVMSTVLLGPRCAAQVLTTVEEAGPADCVYIAGNPDLYPIEYYDSEQQCYRGILPELLGMVAEDTGISFAYVNAGSEDSRLEMARNSQVEMVTAFRRGEFSRMVLPVQRTVLTTETDGRETAICVGFTGIIKEELRERIRPFLMRRLKSEVLSDLPEKHEQYLYAAMPPEQERVYQTLLATLRQHVGQALDEGSLPRARMQVLSVLLKLRQVCCHPKLFLPDYEGTSGKLELLVQTVHSAIDSGRRMLIFSQFVGMLQIIRKRLSREGVSCLYLDGNTHPEERQRLCDRFNGGDGKVFLISLKAGGTGLNLTGADLVIHYDPWWNPAAEDQATDRAHRIGQTRDVDVIKLIAQGTIEEKVTDLSQRKRAIFDRVVISGETALSSLTEEDIRALFFS